jgi:hypothetical protein
LAHFVNKVFSKEYLRASLLRLDDKSIKTTKCHSHARKSIITNDIKTKTVKEKMNPRRCLPGKTFFLSTTSAVLLRNPNFFFSFFLAAQKLCPPQLLFERQVDYLTRNKSCEDKASGCGTDDHKQDCGFESSSLNFSGRPGGSLRAVC